MKIAICLSGLSKCYKHTHEFIKRNFYDRHDCDIFAHTWLDENSQFYKSSTKMQENFFYQNFKDYKIEKFNINDSWNILTEDEQLKMPGPCKNTVPMFYSIYQANILKQNAEEKTKILYDIVIRSRFDSLYEYFLPHNEIQLLKQFKNIIFCGWNGYDVDIKSCRNYFIYNESPAPFVSDNFAFGSSSAMNTYADTYNYLKQFKGNYFGPNDVSGPIPGPEICLGSHLLNNNVNFFRTSYKYKNLIDFDDKQLQFASYYNVLESLSLLL